MKVFKPEEMNTIEFVKKQIHENLEERGAFGGIDENGRNIYDGNKLIALLLDLCIEQEVRLRELEAYNKECEESEFYTNDLPNGEE